MPQPPATEKHYIPTLDGWRAVAILWVMIFHSPPHSFGNFSTAPVRIADGVDLFFALSGFLICTRLLREEAATGTISLRSFYIRRVFRIQPAAITYLAVISLLGLFRVINLRWSGVVSAALMIRNLCPLISPNYPEWYTAHFWSLAVEEHFYLLFPAFLVLVRRHRLKVLCATVVALEIWRWIVYSHPVLQGGAMLLDFRTDMAISFILTGCAFAAAVCKPKLKNLAESWLSPWVAVTLAAVIFTTISLHYSRINHALLVPLYPLLVLSTVLHPASALSRFLSLAPLRFLGRISFSLYLWQQLFLFSYTAPGPGTLRSHILFCWGAASACALASYYIVERPFIHLGHRLSGGLDHHGVPRS